MIRAVLKYKGFDMMSEEFRRESITDLQDEFSESDCKGSQAYNKMFF